MFHFWNLHQILNILKKKMILIATLFGKLDTVKELVRRLSKEQRFRNRFDSQHIKGSQSLVKSDSEHCYQIFWILWETLIRKISPLLICQILVVFRNTLAANDKYPVPDCVNLLSPIEIQLFLKRTIVSYFFVPFLESTSFIIFFHHSGRRWIWNYLP